MADLATIEPGTEPHEDAEPAPAPLPVQQPIGATALERLAAAPARRFGRPALALRTAWAASIVLLLGSAGAAYAWRGRVIAAWPPSARILGNGMIDQGAGPAAGSHQADERDALARSAPRSSH